MIRSLALTILRAARERREFVDDLLDELRPPDAPEADRRLLTQLVLGVTRHRLTLDHLLGRFTKAPMRRMPEELADVLRLGAYQLLFLDRIPAYAAIHESVDCAKRLKGGARAASAANAILRALDRAIARGAKGDDAPSARALPAGAGRVVRFTSDLLPDPADAPAFFATAYSHPRWLVARWLARHGAETARALCAAGNEPPPLTVRVNLRRIDRDALRERLGREGVDASPGGSPEALLLDRPGAIASLPSFQEGLFQPQDETAMGVSRALGPRPGERVLDVCAGPGGKATHLAELLGGAGLVVAVELDPSKSRRLAQGARRLGDDAVIQVVTADGRRTPFRPGASFDAALVDAPCSNTGVLARRADARWRIRPRDLECLPPLQRALLDEAAARVAPGGRLVYATCSIEPEENRDVVRRFLASRPAWRLDAEEETLPSARASGGYWARLVRAEAAGTARGSGPGES
jgi:16S rRNA (cytosine967-C5)-methyltransferase